MRLRRRTHVRFLTAAFLALPLWASSDIEGYDHAYTLSIELPK